MTTTYHVQHRYGFIGDDVSRIVIDCRDAAIFTRLGAVRMAEAINAGLGDGDRRARPVMLTSTSKVRRVSPSVRD